MGASCTGTQHSPDPSTKLATRRSGVSHIGVWEYAFVKMAQDAQLTDMDSYMDNPQIWTAKVKYAINSRVREGEFIYPYKFATGTIKSTKRRNAQRTRSASPGNSSRTGDNCS